MRLVAAMVTDRTPAPPLPRKSASGNDARYALTQGLTRRIAQNWKNKHGQGIPRLHRRSRSRIHRIHLADAALVVLRRRALGLPAEVLPQGMGLQDLGGRDLAREPTGDGGREIPFHGARR